MKAHALFVLTGVALFATAAGASYGPPVLETEVEFLAYGDFLGDGRRHYVVIDRASGGMRMANALVSGDLVMPEPRATGITAVTAVAVGRFTLTSSDAVAVTAPESNRVRVVGPLGTTFDAWLPGTGPRHITGLPMPGGTAGLDDLVGVTVANDPRLFSRWWQLLMLNDTLGFSMAKLEYAPAEPKSGLAAMLIEGDTAIYADLREDTGGLVFSVHDTQDPAVPVLTQRAGIAAGSRAVFGTFNPAHNRSMFVFHVPGQTNIQTSTVEPSRLLGTLAAQVLTTAADWLQPVKAGSQVWLAALSHGGGELRVYSFDSAGVPALRQSVTAPDGMVWTGVLPAADGGWFAASAPPGSASTSLRRYHYSGGATPFTAGSDYAMATLRGEELGCDLLLFDGKPFFDNQPVLRGRYRVGGWTSQLNDPSGFPTSMYGTTESWRGSLLGIGTPVSTYLGIRPDGVTHGLANQISADASFYSLDPPVGTMADLIVFDPPGGLQQSGIMVTLAVNGSGVGIRYCLGDSNQWTNYSQPIGPIHSDTTVRAYVVKGETKTPIQAATYTFPSDPYKIDSDGDGVPDFVEAARGLNPIESGLDGDNDSVPDLQELVCGSDPADPNSTPAPGDLRSNSRHFHVSVEPRTHGGAGYGETLVMLPSCDRNLPGRDGTWVNVNRPDGTTELEGYATVQGGGTVKLVDPQRVVANPPLFWVAGTPDRFMAEYQDADPRRGRGTYRLLDYDATALDPLPSPVLSGTPAEQATQWITAVRDHFSANAGVDVGGTLSFVETLDLLLVERALGHIFHQRGWISTAKLSLTPFRGDSTNPRWTPPPGTAQPDRHAVRETWLSQLASTDYGDDGYDWHILLAFIRHGIISSTVTREQIDRIAREVYRIAFHAFEDPDHPLPVRPFDALRQFIDDGTLPDGYMARLNVPGSLLTGARDYLAAFNDALPERTHTVDSLLLVADTGCLRSPWLVLDATVGGEEYWLADESGAALPLPADFLVQPGTRFLATGHVRNRSGGGKLLFVDSITLLEAPLPAIADQDQNLLDDDWEALVFGRLGNDPFADPDDDDYMTLQEMFELSDAMFGPAIPSVAALDLRPPQLQLTPVGPREFRLHWRWPEAYHDRVRFRIGGSSDLLNYQIREDDVPATSGDLFEAEVDAETAAARYFFRVGLGLRP